MKNTNTTATGYDEDEGYYKLPNMNGDFRYEPDEGDFDVQHEEDMADKQAANRKIEIIDE